MVVREKTVTVAIAKIQSIARICIRDAKTAIRANARFGSGKDSGLERREDYRTRRPALHRSDIARHLGQQIAYARSIGVVPPWTKDPPR
jgi:hypothetical protein